MSGGARTFAFDPESHTYLVGGIPTPSCTGVLKSSGFVPPAFLDQDMLERRSELGRAVHKACDLCNREKEFTCDPAVRGYLNSWIETKRRLALDLKLSEFQQIGEINGMLYGMQLDALALVGHEEHVIELKIGPIFPHHGLQLAGYAAGLYHPRFETALARFRVRKRIALQLNEHGLLAILHRFDEKSDFDVFTSMLHSMHWKKKHEKFYKGSTP